MKETSEICTTFVPTEIIDHLWNIVEIYGENKYVFVLSSRRLGDAMVQDIRIIAGGSSYIHSVYGFKPVDFTIKVNKNNDDYSMTLMPSVKAEREINKWKQRKFGFFLLKKLTPAPRNFRVRRAW